jgi:hypothetical protein
LHLAFIPSNVFLYSDEKETELIITSTQIIMLECYERNVHIMSLENLY